jgi:hypothetical protein
VGNIGDMNGMGWENRTAESMGLYILIAEKIDDRMCMIWETTKKNE